MTRTEREASFSLVLFTALTAAALAIVRQRHTRAEAGHDVRPNPEQRSQLRSSAAATAEGSAPVRERAKRPAWLRRLAYLVPLGGLSLALMYLPRTFALLAAFLIATALERHRQSARSRPLRLVDTPRAWRSTLNATVGVPAAVVLLALGAGAVALERARFGLEQTTTTTVNGDARTAQQRPPRLPRLAVRRYPPSRSFVLAGARFTVHPSPRAGWAAQIGRSPARPGQRWITIAIETRNLRRHRFDPNTLAYRLRDHRGSIYNADIGGGTGPPSLSTPGLLRPGLSAESRLGFRVPRRIRHFELVFEPSIGGSVQARVPIAASSGSSSPKWHMRPG